MKYLQLMRVKHWIKNLLLFFPIIFSGQLLKPDVFVTVFMGFLIFNFTASIIYILNDFKDLERDRQHPKKKNRPLASGQVSKAEAIGVVLLLTVAVIILAVLSRYSPPSPVLLVLSVWLFWYECCLQSLSKARSAGRCFNSSRRIPDTASMRWRVGENGSI